MNKKLFAVAVPVLVAASTAFGQGYVTFGSGQRTLWDDFSNPGTPRSPAAGSVNVTFLWATNGTPDPFEPVAVSTNNNAASEVNGTDWGVINYMLTNGWQVAYDSRASNYVVAQPVNSLGSFAYDGINAFPLAGTEGSGQAIEIVVVAWDAASGTNAIFNGGGQALGWSAPFDYVTGSGPPATPPQETTPGHFGIAPTPNGGQPPSAPSITNQPQDFVATGLGPASFNVTATGTFAFSYQWSFNGSPILNATNNVFSIPAVRQSDLGAYDVLVTNAYGAVTSSIANLYMYPFIENPFTGLDTYWGQTNTLSVGAWGSGDLSYQWYQNGVALADATNSTLTISDIQFTNAGSYYVVVSSTLGSATNSTYQVIVNPANVTIKLTPDVVIQGTVGNTYIIESTTNLSDPNSWIVETNLTLTQPIENWNDNSTDINSSPRKFYQVLPGQ